MKTCAYPGCTKPVSSKRAKTCSYEHAAMLRKLQKDREELQSPNEGLVECTFETCHNRFKPRRKSQIYCSGEHFIYCQACGKKKIIRKDKLRNPPIACSPHCAAKLGHTEESKQKRKENSQKKWGTDNPFQADEVKDKIKKHREEHPETDYSFGTENAKRRFHEIYGDDVDNASQLESVKEKKKQTSREHYSVDYPAQNEEVQKKTKDTNLHKYGVETPLQLPEHQAKVRETSLKKYGTEYPLQAPEVREKLKQSNREKYGTDFPIQSELGKERIRKTNREKYGTDWAFQSDEIKQRITNTLHEKYGDDVDNPFQAEPVKEKIRQTNLEKYGVENPMQSEAIKEKAALSIFDLLNAGEAKPNGPVSKKNLNFADEIMSYSEDIHVDYEYVIPHTGKRIDFRFYTDAGREVFVDLNPTISHNSEKSYHCIMTKCQPTIDGKEHVCKDPAPEDYSFGRAKIMRNEFPDTDYIQVWDWDDRETMIQLITGKLLPFTKKYSARKLILHRIDKTQANKILEEWHPQGSCKGQTYCYTLNDPDTDLPVILATFGKPRFAKKFDYEWLRTAVAQGVEVYGGQSRLLQAFLQDVGEESSIISYIDFSKTTREHTFLNYCGFKEAKPTGKTLVWSKGTQAISEPSLLSRGADVLLGTSYGSREECGMDNHDIMLSEGWLPVYTAGNRRFTFNI